jgi:hypothetical protein
MISLLEICFESEDEFKSFLPDYRSLQVFLLDYWTGAGGGSNINISLIYQIEASCSKLKGVKAAEPIFLKFFTVLT